MEDPLNISVPLANVDASYPLMPVADYQFQVTESVVEPNAEAKKGNGTGRNWRVQVATTSPITSVDGREIKVGTKLNIYGALQAKDDSEDKQAYVRGLCNIVDGIYGTDKSNRPDLSGEVITGALGKTVIGRVTITKDNQGHDQNNVRLKKGQPVA